MQDMYKPTLLIQTVYFADTERKLAVELGLQLYDHLTRPREERLAFGAGIPVRVGCKWDRVDTEAAQKVLVVPVLGRDCHGDEDQRAAALRAISEWNETLGQGHVVPLFTSKTWEAEQDTLPVQPILRKLYSDKRDSWTNSLIEIVIAACRLVSGEGGRLQLFISHAKRDLEKTDEVAACIRQYADEETVGDAFFDTTDLKPGHDLEDQLKKGAREGVFVAVRSDAYSSRAWCQRELLTAKQFKVPTLTVVVLRQGEIRSYPYGGNSPTMLWNKKAPGSVVLRAFVEYLKACHFSSESQRIISHADLPEETIRLPRAPELLDLAQGPLRGSAPALVLHPDPELSKAEREVLREARPRLRLATPSTVYRQLLGRQETARMAAPLAGKQVALSLSDSPDAGGESCFTRHHVDDATVYVARSLISAGAAIAYGGDFRKCGFDELLAQLIQAYNQTGVDRADYLHSYIAAPIARGDIPDDLPFTKHSLAWTQKIAEEAIMPPPDGKLTPARRALYFSDMRRVMARRCFARVILGGQASPKKNGAKKGYGGRYPGVVEEAWRTLKTNRPLYVVGGYGGAAGMVADLFEGRDTPKLLCDDTFADNPEYSEFRQRAVEWEGDEFREKLGLPVNMESLCKDLSGHASRLSDDDSIAWNGLTVEENKALFRSQDPVLISGLVMKGLFQVFMKQSSGKKKIELVRGSITRAEAVDALAIATFSDVPVGGAGAELDHLLTRRVTTALRDRHKLVEISGPEIDADWLIIAELGALAAGGKARILEAVEGAARQVAEETRRHGFQRVGVITFGGSVIAKLEDVVDRMLKGFAPAAPNATLVWFETNDKRFERLQEVLRKQPDTTLTTRILERRPPIEVTAREDLVASVRYENDFIHSIVLPPRGVAAAAANRERITPEDLEELTKSYASVPPPWAELQPLGAEVAAKVFGKSGCKLLRDYSKHRLVVLHDPASSAIPFELLSVDNHRFALGAGLVRRPALEGLRLQDVTSRPRHVGALNLFLVANTIGDLPGTEVEADSVRNALENRPEIVIREDLRGSQATKEKILEVLEDPEIDVFHYSGHAFFDGVGEEQSGLVCAGQIPLYLKDLIGRKVFPRIAFFNGCETARVRKLRVPDLARAFAEFFLRGGVEAYLGTFWQVGDAAAASFAATVYLQLAAGASLDEAVRTARLGLDEKKSPDWANYVLFGAGSFQLVKGGDDGAK